jgi:hypothetical protein
MRSLVLGLMIVALPAYATGQQPESPERSATGRTAVPRDGAAPAKAIERRLEPRGETRTSSPREEQPHVAAASARGPWTNKPTLSPRPSIPFPNVGPRPFPNLQHWGLVQPSVDSRPRYRRPHSGPNVVFVPYASPVFIEREVIVEREVLEDRAPARASVEPPLLARLILDIHPPTAQIFADGYYIGIPEDFRFADGGAVLEPGPHRIDIVAREYEPISFDVNLARGQSATFRHNLTPIRPSPRPAPDTTVNTPPAAKKPTTFYLIRGCYMGNVPPKDANLPATCDIARAVSFQY